MNVEILSAGFFCTVQDLGRYGYQRFGVPVSGAMDEFAFRSANLLVGNPQTAAGLECGPGELAFRASEGILFAVCAPSGELRVGGKQQPLWTAVWASTGQEVGYQAVTQGGTWSVIALAGGIDTPFVLGSRSTYLRAGLGGLDGRALQGGESLRLGASYGSEADLSGQYLPANQQIAYSQELKLGIIPGPQIDRFDGRALEELTAKSYTVKPDSDRMGYRLEGQAISPLNGADIYSEGMRMGAVQAPANGMPMVMMADCPTTGGYTKIGYVSRVDLPLLAQRRPGETVKFFIEDVESAQRRYREMYKDLGRKFVRPADDPDVVQWAGAIK